MQIELLQKTLLENHAKEFNNLSETFWLKVNQLLSEVLIARAQGKDFSWFLFVFK